MGDFINNSITAFLSLVIFLSILFIGKGITGAPIIEVTGNSNGSFLMVGLFLSIVSALFLYFRFQVNQWGGEK